MRRNRSFVVGPSARLPRFAARLLAGLLALGGAGCGGMQPATTQWPPRDFYLEVRARIQTAAGQRELQSLHVFADGYSVYREVDAERSFPGGWPPVFSRVSAYRMLPASTRSLARGLQRAGLFALDTLVGADPDANEVLSIRWIAFGQDRRIVARGRVFGAFMEALHVINAFLPPDCVFELPEMVGEPQPPRLAGVARPVRDLAGAYAMHQQWADRWTGDVQWLVELFALALSAADLGGARAVLENLEREYATGAPLSDGSAAEALAALRALFVAAGG